MKLSNLVLLAILGVIGYKIVQLVLLPPPPPPAVIPIAVASTPTPPPTPARPQEWPRGALQVIHGKVIEVTAHGLVISISEVGSAPITARRATAQTFRDALKKGEEEDLAHFGPVMTMENGTPLHAAKDIPSIKADGTVMLKDYPNERAIAPGTLINIVAAPLADHDYTAQFTTTKEDPNAWRLNYKGAMDRH